MMQMRCGLFWAYPLVSVTMLTTLQYASHAQHLKSAAGNSSVFQGPSTNGKAQLRNDNSGFCPEILTGRGQFLLSNGARWWQVKVDSGFRRGKHQSDYCTMHRYNPEEARQCFKLRSSLDGRKNKVILLGDSTIQHLSNSWLSQFGLPEPTRQRADKRFMEFDIPLWHEIWWRPFFSVSWIQDMEFLRQDLALHEDLPVRRKKGFKRQKAIKRVLNGHKQIMSKRPPMDTKKPLKKANHQRKSSLGIARPTSVVKDKDQSEPPSLLVARAGYWPVCFLPDEAAGQRGVLQKFESHFRLWADKMDKYLERMKTQRLQARMPRIQPFVVWAIPDRLNSTFVRQGKVDKCKGHMTDKNLQLFSDITQQVLQRTKNILLWRSGANAVKDAEDKGISAHVDQVHLAAPFNSLKAQMLLNAYCNKSMKPGRGVCCAE